MTPELRKEASELQLHKRGIRINVQLHVIEADEEVTLRKAAEVEARLWALWAVSQAAASADPAHTRAIYDYLHRHNLLGYCSPQELVFLSQTSASAEQTQQFRERLHAFHFLCWCAGLLDKIDLSAKPINSAAALRHFPTISASGILSETETPLSDVIKLRRKDAIMDWSDLLYRLHWAVRHAQLNDKPSPGNIDSVMVREWHQAVNWMCCYEDEHDWDKVSTETTA